MEWKLFADLAERTGEKQVAVDADAGATVEDALEALLEEHPALEERVVTADGELRSEINVLRNGANVRTEPEGIDTTVEPDDELALLPPVSGG